MTSTSIMEVEASGLLIVMLNGSTLCTVTVWAQPVMLGMICRWALIGPLPSAVSMRVQPDFGFWILDFGLMCAHKDRLGLDCRTPSIHNPKFKIQNRNTFPLLPPPDSMATADNRTHLEDRQDDRHGDEPDH